MTESEKLKSSSEADDLALTASGPLVFISHDGRDAELAEAFSKLLKERKRRNDKDLPIFRQKGY